MAAHILDRPVWHALTSRQAPLALGTAQALRFDPDYGLFAASADLAETNLAALAALIPPDATIGLVEAFPVPPPPGTRLMLQRAVHQMMADRIAPDDVGFAVVPLGDDDAPTMLALAALTEPGPFFRRTHRLGGFVGVKQNGRLVAMAGERMKIFDRKMGGFTEVSGVCTRPEARGRGYAGGLMRIVAARIAARGETPFLHVWSDNAGAIALYESLGYRLRRQMVLTVLARA